MSARLSVRVRIACVAAAALTCASTGARVAAQQPPSAWTPAAAPGAQPQIRSKLVQGNVWIINAGFVNAAAQIGTDGVLVVDTGTEALGAGILAEIQRLAEGKPIRYIINTHAHPDHVGGNVVVAKAGESIIAGNFAGQAGPDAASAAKIIAHEHALARMSEGEGNNPPATPSAAWPTDTFFTRRFDMFFNGEPVQVLYQPNAHTDSDVIVYFRHSDVIVTGDVYVNTSFPIVNLAEGGSLNGIVAALNRIIELTVPKDKQEGGTFVIPGHGRIADEADVVEYRDMTTILRDRFQDAVKKKMTLEQVKAARLVRDYEGRYGAAQGFWTTDAFVEAAYRSLSQPKPAARETSK